MTQICVTQNCVNVGSRSRKSPATAKPISSSDSRFAAARAGLADALDNLVQYGYMPPRDGMEEARRAAERAIAPQRFCERTGKGPISYAAAALASRNVLHFHSTPVNGSHKGLHSISFPFNMLETVSGVHSRTA